MTIGTILSSQTRTLRLFLTHPPTRTPVIVLYVVSFGGALHAAVTTYFYLAIGANEVDIGQLGFVMSVGMLIGSPLSGLALDRYGPWIPISVTAGACAWGCLWRGMASGLASLRLGAILLGIGVNMWTVVLGHLVISFPANMRSEVLSGYGVQMTMIELLGKGTFPFVEYTLHHIVGMEDALARYRIHMGLCTFFCFYGTFALFWDRRNVQQQVANDERGAGGGIIKYQHKHSDVVDESEGANDGQLSTQGIELGSAPSSGEESIHSLSISERGSSESLAEKSLSTSTSTFLNEPEPPSEQDAKPRMATAEESGNPWKFDKHVVTTIILTLALLLQSVSTTVLTILWPLLAHDQFDLSAHSFGILTFVSSVVSTGAVAAFPVVERLEKVGGRVRCAALGFGLGSILCVLFCFCSFNEYYSSGAGAVLVGAVADNSMVGVQADASERRSLEEEHDVIQQLNWRNQFLFHALSAMTLQAVLCFLEPSLKSILSIVVHSPSKSPSSKSSLGGVVGFMQTLGSIGGMIGNLAGTWMYKLSKDMAAADVNAPRILQGGSLPFIALSVFMAFVSILIFCLEEPAHFEGIDGGCTTAHGGDVESGRGSGDGAGCINSESTEDAKNGTPEGSCLALRETTYDLKLD